MARLTRRFGFKPAPTDFEILGQVAKCNAPDEFISALGVYSNLDGTNRFGTIESVDFRLAYYVEQGVLVRDEVYYRLAEGVQCGPLPSAQLDEIKVICCHSHHVNWGRFDNSRPDMVTGQRIWTDVNGNPPDDGAQEWEEGYNGIFIWSWAEGGIWD